MIESREGPETCNTYNMLRLTEQLFRAKPAARIRRLLRARRSTTTSSRRSIRSMAATSTSRRSGRATIASTRSRRSASGAASGRAWRTRASTATSSTRIGGDELFVNLFVASVLSWPERGLTVRQETAFPDEARTRLILSLATPRHFTMHIRHPGWVAAGAFRIRINGQAFTAPSTPASYLAIARDWRDGDRVDVELPMRTRLERLPDGSDYAAVLHGPILLAAKTGTERLDGLIAGAGRMAHTSAGPYEPLDAAPMLVGDPASLAGPCRTRCPAGRSPSRAPDAIRPAAARGLELVPFFRVHDSRYVIYWRVATPQGYQRVVSALREEERIAAAPRDADARSRRARRTAERGGSRHPQRGLHHWRHARPSLPRRDRRVRLRAEARHGGRAAAADRHLPGGRARASLRDPGRRSSDRIGRARRPPAGSLHGRGLHDSVDVIAADADGVLTVRFVAEPGSRAGAVYDVRLVRPE